MTGENIVCIAKDWDDDPTSNSHVMRLLASGGNRVLWLNSIGMRRPTIASGRDLRRIGRKLREFARGPQAVLPNLWVATPLVLPLPHSRVATRLNQSILRVTVGWFARSLGMRSFQLWSFLPNAAEYAGRLGESLMVYYCTDNWSRTHAGDAASLGVQEAELCRKADVVFATSTYLMEAKRALNPETYLASHGVDHAHFSQALDPSMPVAPEIADAPGPVIGVIGLIDERVDVALLATIARRHPEWTLAIVGQVLADLRPLAGLPNILLIGRQPYERLPQFCRGFSVGLIPFVVNEYTRAINPIKLREYLSAGLPVVSTPLPEVAAYRTLVRVAPDHEEFIRGVEVALAEDSPAGRRQRGDAMRSETWEAKVQAIGRQVDRALQSKRR